MQIHETITVPRPIEEAFDFTADFTNIEQWDPGVARSTRLDDGPLGIGSRFDLLVAFGARRIPMVYTITKHDRPHEVVLVGEGSALAATDTIAFAEVGGGTEITYTAELEFKGLLRLVVPFLGGVVRGVGRKAVSGLERELS